MMELYEDEMKELIEQMRRSIMNRIDYSKAVTDSDVYELIDMEIFMSDDFMIRYMSPAKRVPRENSTDLTGPFLPEKSFLILFSRLSGNLIAS